MASYVQAAAKINCHLHQSPPARWKKRNWWNDLAARKEEATERTGNPRKAELLHRHRGVNSRIRFATYGGSIPEPSLPINELHFCFDSSLSLTHPH